MCTCMLKKNIECVILFDILLLQTKDKYIKEHHTQVGWCVKAIHVIPPRETLTPRVQEGVWVGSHDKNYRCERLCE